MKEHDATELAFNNGYEKAVREIFADLENLFGVATEASMLAEIFETPNYKRFKRKYMEKGGE